MACDVCNSLNYSCFSACLSLHFPYRHPGNLQSGHPIHSWSGITVSFSSYYILLAGVSLTGFLSQHKGSTGQRSTLTAMTRFSWCCHSLPTSHCGSSQQPSCLPGPWPKHLTLCVKTKSQMVFNSPQDQFKEFSSLQVLDISQNLSPSLLLCY